MPQELSCTRTTLRQIPKMAEPFILSLLLCLNHFLFQIMRLIKQIPLDAPSIVRMDNVISKIGSLLKPIFEHPILQQDADNNLALGIDVFMCAALDVDRAIIKDDDLLTMASGFKEDYTSYISQTQTDLMPLLKHSISRGVPNERIIEYGLEGFIERLLVAYPSYMPLMLKGLFN